MNEPEVKGIYGLPETNLHIWADESRAGILVHNVQNFDKRP